MLESLSLAFGFLSAFLGVMVAGSIVVALVSMVAAIPLLGGFVGLLLAIVAVICGVGGGIIALIGAPIGVLVRKRMVPKAMAPMESAPPPTM